MYKRLSAVLFPIVALFLIGTAYWGYQEHQEKNSILIKAENQYQRAFHDLSYHVDKLHSELGNTLAVNSTSQGYHRKGLVNVWRITSEAQNEINQLPLTLLPFSKTEDFLSRISNFSYKAGLRDLTKKPLSKDEYKTLKTLYQNSKQISNDLRQVQAKVIKSNLRWMDVESAMATEKEPQDNTIIDGFKTVDKKVGQYPEINWGPSVSSVYNKRSVKMLSGNAVSAEDIKKRAHEFFGNNITDVKVSENGKKTEYESYTATGVRRDTHSQIHMDFTKKGGLLTSYMDTRDIGKKRISRDQAKKAAEKFLKDRKYPDMEAVNYDEYDNLGSFVFAHKEKGVVIYPERVTVRVALDTGEVTGLQANDLVYKARTKRTVSLKPKLTLAEARKMLNPDFKETHHRLAVIENDLAEEVLCYEFTGGINGSKYRIYLNAENGIEENIEQIKTAK